MEQLPFFIIKKSDSIIGLATVYNQKNYFQKGKTNEISDGINYVIVNGEVVVEGKKVNDILPGEAIPMESDYWEKSC